MKASISSVLSLTILCIAVASVYSLSAISVRQHEHTLSHQPSSPTNSRTKEVTRSSIHIRTTKEGDLPTIIDLLAFESSKQDNSPSILNWNAKIQLLKNQNSLSSQLKHRFAAINAGHSLRYSHFFEKYDEANVDISSQQILWSHDGFRDKVEKAVKVTREYIEYPTQWDEHNFSLTPDASMLKHFMITAADSDFVGANRENLEPVGFCEVGVLSSPQDEPMFCVGNLVVSPNQRRRGIGERLMDCAIRLIQRYGQDFDALKIGLYVDGDNVNAIKLYEKMGFKAAGECNHVQGRIFMILHNTTSRTNLLADMGEEIGSGS